MKKNNLSFTKLKWFGFLSVILIFTVLFQQSCKKADFNNAVIVQPVSKNLEKEFLQFPSNTSPTVQRIANLITEQNKQYHFVNDIATKEGLPVWNKAKIQLQHKPASLNGFGANTTTNNITGEDTLVLIPLVLQNTEFVNSFLACAVGDSVSIRLVSARDYAQFGFHNITDSISANKVALETMLLEQSVFGHSEYNLADQRLFKHTENGITMNPAFIKLKVLDSSIAPSIVMQVTNCVEVTTSGGFLTGCPPGEEHCIDAITYLECNTWTIWIGPTGGNGGDPCTSCVEWWIPPGGIVGGTGSIGWYHSTGLTEEQQADIAWVNNYVKDSTFNACISQALTTLKNINDKLPKLVRNFFNTTGTPDFQMNIKMENLEIYKCILLKFS